MSDSIGAMSNVQNSMASQQSQVSSGFANQMSDAIRSSVSPQTGKLDASEATDKLQMIAASTTNPTEKAACNEAISQLQNATSGTAGQNWDSKLADSIAGTALASAMAGNSASLPQNAGNFAFSDALQVTLNNNHPQSAGNVQFNSHLFGPQPISNAAKATDRPDTA